MRWTYEVLSQTQERHRFWWVLCISVSPSQSPGTCKWNRRKEWRPAARPSIPTSAPTQTPQSLRKQQTGSKIVNHYHFQAMITLLLSNHNDLYSSQTPTPHVRSLWSLLFPFVCPLLCPPSLPMQRRIQDFPDGGTSPWVWGKKVLFGKSFSENCMNMKWIRQCNNTF